MACDLYEKTPEELRVQFDFPDVVGPVGRRFFCHDCSRWHSIYLEDGKYYVDNKEVQPTS